MTEATNAYSERAAEYAKVVGSMGAVHPSDRVLVETWADSVRGPLLDAGCGPGHWTDHLHARGHDIRGIDGVPAFIAHARALYPEVRYTTGDIDAIDVRDGSLSGILSWFSTIHHEPGRLPVPLGEFARALRPGGRLLLGYFASDDGVEPFDHAVVRAYRWPAPTLHARVEAAGFDVVESHRRSERGRRPVGALLCEVRSDQRPTRARCPSG